MAPPTLTFTAQRLYDALEPLTFAEEENDYPLAHYCAALAKNLDEYADLSRDVGDVPGWGLLFDPDLTPEKFLQWLGQYVGVEVPENLSVPNQRSRIKRKRGFQRGSPTAIKEDVAEVLTGGKTVFLTERHGSAYRITVATRTSETPDAAVVQKAALAQKPAGIVMLFSLVPGGTYIDLRDTHSDYTDVRTQFATYTDARDNPQLT